jgi:hypothetical protein
MIADGYPRTVFALSAIAAGAQTDAAIFTRPSRDQVPPCARLTVVTEPEPADREISAVFDDPTENKLSIERRDDGTYAVRRGNSQRTSAVTDTQREAIERAKELNPGHRPDVERVRNRQGWPRRGAESLRGLRIPFSPERKEICSLEHIASLRGSRNAQPSRSNNGQCVLR